MFYWKNMSWEIGMRWGDHHPDPVNKDWYGEKSVSIVDNEIHLNILKLPKYFDDINSVRQFCSGCVSSIGQVHYGRYHFEYTLPLGRHICPAIWLYSAKHWPPEIDIMEGWTGNKTICGRVRRDYRGAIPWKNEIFPSLHYSEGGVAKCLTLHDGLLHGTMACKQPTEGRCTCDMTWSKDKIEIMYDGRLVVKYTDKKIMSLVDEPMTIILDLFCGHDFSMADYDDYQMYGREFIIHDLSYSAN